MSPIYDVELYQWQDAHWVAELVQYGRAVHTATGNTRRGALQALKRAAHAYNIRVTA